MNCELCKARLLLCLPLFFATASAQKQPMANSLNIWEGDGSGRHVELTPYLAENTEGSIGVVVCPGGSYFWHAMETEGHEVGRWLQQNGISAFVLKYRTAKWLAFATHYRKFFRGPGYPDPQDDMRQAMGYLKQHAAQLRLDSLKIGVMGFSAGGHLAMSAAELFGHEDRPAFVAAVYPVVSMTHPCMHKRSRRGLLGEKHKTDKVLCDQLSLERHVPDDCPPVFIVNCKDDPVVDYRNSVLLDSALTAEQIAHCYVQFQTGGHGFGMSEEKGTPECRQWKFQFLDWVSQLFK